MEVIVIIACIGLVIWGIKKLGESTNSASGTNTTAPPSRTILPGGSTWIYYAATTNASEDNRYEFKFRENHGHWRAYIIRTPRYGNRDTSSATAHWLSDGGQRYICVAGGDPSSLQRMQNLAMTWADRTQRYINYGTPLNQA